VNPEVIAWAQHRLGVDVTGVWDDASRAECRAVQGGAGVPETGELDDATLAALAPEQE
jgi:shikimate kinase